MTTSSTIRLTQYAAGGGCACKLPPGQLEELLASVDLGRQPSGDVIVDASTGDDAAVVRLEGEHAIVCTADFFTPVVDDPFDWGRIAATNALSDVYAMGGEPVVAVNLLCWPREVLPLDLAAEVLAGGAATAASAGCLVGGGHSIDDAEPKFGMAVTGVAHPDRLLRNDAATPGLPLTLTKPLGLGVLNNRHKVTGEVFAEAVDVMTTLNRRASAEAVRRGVRAATDVTGFGLLGHLLEMVRASGVSATVDAAAVPYVEGARESLAQGFVPGGSRRNVDWVRPHLDSRVTDEEVLLLSDAQTSGGLLVVGELPGHPVIGEVTHPGEWPITVR